DWSSDVCSSDLSCRKALVLGKNVLIKSFSSSTSGSFSFVSTLATASSNSFKGSASILAIALIKVLLWTTFLFCKSIYVSILFIKNDNLCLQLRSEEHTSELQ